MSQHAARGSKRRARLLLVVAAAAVAAVAVGAILSRNSRPQDLPAKLGDWIVQRDPSCLDGKPEIKRSRPSARPDLYPDLLPHAESLSVVACEYLGPVTVVLKFGSRAELTRAFAASKDARSSKWCFTGREAFDGSTLDPGELETFCRRLRGTIR